MQTNQMMTVTIGDYGSVLIGHKTKMGKAKDIMAMGNLTREIKGLRPIELKDILRSQDFWEFVVEYHNSNSSQMAIIDFESKELRTKQGRLEYSKLIPMFPKLIQSKRGKYGGTWMNLYLLLKLATKLDKALEVQIYKTFVEGSILEYRDEGGTNFNKFKQLLKDKFSINKTEESSLIFSRALRENIFGREVVTEFRKEYPKDNIWNSDLATDAIQEKRTKLEDKLCMLVEEGFIMDADTLLAYISKNFSLPKPRESSFDNVEFKY